MAQSNYIVPTYMVEKKITTDRYSATNR